MKLLILSLATLTTMLNPLTVSTKQINRQNKQNNGLISNYTYKIDKPITKFAHINNQINDYIDSKLEGFLQYENNDGMKYDFYTEYTKNTYKNFTFIQIYVYMFVGGAHYSVESKQITFDENGNLLELKDFFKDKAYLATISNISYKILLAKNINSDETWIKNGTEALLDNYSLYYFNESGLNIIFPPYQVAPWVSGHIKITIDYNELKNIM